jgi:hypothetical protein
LWLVENWLLCCHGDGGWRKYWIELQQLTAADLAV